MTFKPDKKIDCQGLFCPEPVYRTRLELDEMEIGETLEVLADDPAARSDIETLVNNLGHEILSIEEKDDVTRIIIKKVK
ncbi:MAG: sulfurtransferase TusA family protein [Candidatus Bathyarchaeota archaeon]|jgi:TusA-related sulfurtransferase|nr:sulfurtransferase TusA family protein [Candidatus Bathyarchaeota archaeon]